MNPSSKSVLNGKDIKLNLPNKVTTLNPNAAEFVPSALRSLSENNKKVDVARLVVPGTSVKPCLDRSESNVSNNSDDEAHQFWRRQLPDDITPDFKIMGEEELQASGGLSLAGLSINDDIETTRLSMTMGSPFLGKRQEISPRGSDHINLSERMAYSGLSFSEDNSSTALMSLGTNLWDKQFMNGDQLLTNSREGNQYGRDSNAGFLNDLLNEHAVLENAAVNPVEFLASQFPGFAADSLAEVYYANGCDLNLTIEILTQLELQVDNGFNQNIHSKGSSAPTLSVLDFPALPVLDSQDGLSKYNGEDLQQVPNALQSGASRVTPDFASAVRRLASQDSGHWKNERNVSADATIGSSINSQLSAGSYNGHGKTIYADKLQYPGIVQAVPAWLETGDAVAQIYSESREEARDFARLRNSCFEQATQAYIIGNKALAKELSVKGQLYSIQMKEAHEKAKELIYRQRNPVAPELQFYNRGKDPLIDLHGLHVNEAINVLKHELSILRRTAKSSGQRLQVMICVGTGHHTKGSRTPRLPVAIQRYLLDEKLQFSEDQPGLLRVVIR
uniref:NEDD4-binding protein 2 n=1 Tax=Anthurium amnicola TaxID=1678845 RepID=A0A1D1YWV1_9ARAE